MFEALLRRATTMGLRKGVGGSRPWLYAGIVAVGLRVIRHLASPEPEVLYRTRLRGSDAFQITATPTVSRRQARKERRSGN
jgi:hypothetical protein